MNSISQDSQKLKYKCDRCRDTGFVEIKTENKKLQPTMKICICQRKHKVKQQWEKYGVDPKKVKTIAEYNAYNMPLLDKAKNLALNYVFNVKENNNWIAFLGQSGAGKSHLSIGIGAMLLKQNYEVAYMPYAEIIMELKRNTMNQEAYTKILNKFMKAEILVIDDLFKDKIKNNELIGDLNEADLRHIYPLLNYRYNNNLRTIISSEANLNNLRKLDEALLGRILEKCNENIIVFETSKYNHRFRKSDN